MTVTEEELTQLEAWSKAATAGPFSTGCVDDAATLVGPQGDQVVLPFGRAYSDARFFAAARDAVPALIAEVRRLRKPYQDALSVAAQEICDSSARQLVEVIAERDALRNDVDRLVEVLEWLNRGGGLGLDKHRRIEAVIDGKGRLADITAERDQLRRQLDAACTKVELLDTQRRGYANDTDALRAENERLRAELDELPRRLNAVDVQEAELRAENERLQNEKADLQLGTAQLTLDCRELRASLADAAAANLAFNVKAAQEINEARRQRDEALASLADAVVKIAKMEPLVEVVRCGRTIGYDTGRLDRAFDAYEASLRDIVKVTP